MGLQGLSAFVQSDGIFQFDLALFQARDDGLKFLERPLEAQLFDGLGRAFCGLRYDGAPTVLSFRATPTPQRTIIAIMAPPSQLRAPAQMKL